MGFVLGILNAFTASLQNLEIHRLPNVSALFLNLVRFAGGVIILAFLVTLWGQWKIPALPFWLIILLISLPAEIINGICYVKAFQYSPQSLVGPLFSLSAIFLVPLSFLFLGERPTLWGFLGICLIVFGVFVTGWQKGSVITTVRNIFSDRGSRFMFIATLFAAVAVMASKSAYQYAPPLLYGFYITILEILVYFPLALSVRHKWPRGKQEWKTMGWISTFYSIGAVFHFVGLSLTLASYYVATKRFSVIFDTVVGKIAGKEEVKSPRFIAAILMFTGLVLTILFG